MALTGTRIGGSLSPGYFRLLKQEEAMRQLVGQSPAAIDTLYGGTAKALGDVYGERMRSLQQSHRQKYGQMDLDIAERRLEIEEEAQKDRALGETIAGVGNLAAMGAMFIPGVGPLVSGAIGLGTRALTSPTSAPSGGWIQPSYDEYYGGYSGPQQGVESTWPSESRFLSMGSNLLFGSGGK